MNCKTVQVELIFEMDKNNNAVKTFSSSCDKIFS